MRLSHIARGALAAENGRRYMMLRGCTPNGHPLWDGGETGTLVRWHPDYDAAVAINTRRTRIAHYGKAGRLGLARAVPRWSDNEVLRLHRLFGRASREELLAALPGRTWAAICKRAHKDGYRRSAMYEPQTGIRVIDQILARRKRLNLTLRELDKMCFAPNYFKGRKWRYRIDARVIARAVALLGGELRAQRK